MSCSANHEEYIHDVVQKQRQLLEARDNDLMQLRQKISEYEQALIEKDHYLARLEMDLEHAIRQCKNFAEERIQARQQGNTWINRDKPGVESK